MNQQMQIEFEWGCHVLRWLARSQPNVEKCIPKESFVPSESLRARAREIEKTSGHDVNALVRAVTEKYFPEADWVVHWGMTSEDLNGLANAEVLLECRRVCGETMAELLAALEHLAKQCPHPIAARTHGQLAVPTTFQRRLTLLRNEMERVWKDIEATPIVTKFGGAIGDCQEMIRSWKVHSPTDPSPEKTIEQLIDDFEPFASGRIQRVPGFQTQLYSDLGIYLGKYVMLMGVMIKANQDLAYALSGGYFELLFEEGRVGSSTMAQKRNPANSEGARGAWKFARGQMMTLMQELPLFTFEREIMDSMMLRNLPVMFGYFLLGMKRWIRDLRILSPLVDNEVDSEVDKEVEDNGQIFAAWIQTFLRLKQVPDAYERARKMTQGRKMSRTEMLKAVTEAFPEIPAEDFQELMKSD